MRDTYKCKEEFLLRDAPKMGYDGINTNTGSYNHTYYVNGDHEPFRRIWFPLSDFADGMIKRGDFGKKYALFALKHDDDLKKIAKWQMKVIGDFYNRFCKPGKKIIGGPTDVIVLRPKNPLPKLVSIYFQGGPINGWVHDLRNHDTNTVIVKIDYSRDDENVPRNVRIGEIATESIKEFTKYSYYSRTDKTHKSKEFDMAVFTFIAPS